MFDDDRATEKPALWMINQYAITPDLPGGTRHYDFGCELVKQGWDVTIFASDINLALRKHTKLGERELWREEVVDGVRFVWVQAAPYQQNNWRRAWNMASFALNFMRVAPHIAPSPRVIIGSSPHLFTPLGAWWVARRKRARFVLELRDLWPQALIDMTGVSENRPSVRLMRLMEAFSYRVAGKIVVLARGSEDYLMQRNVPRDRVAYIPNGVHMDNFGLGIDDTPASRDKWRGEFGFTGFTIVYTGAHGPANALHAVLSAAEILGEQGYEVQFVLVGDGPTKADLMADSDRRGLRNVRFMDPVPKATVPRLLAASDAAVITLRSVDAFSYAISPNKLFDYMAAARPIICSVPGDMAQLVSQSGAGYSVPPENAQALAEAVSKLAALPEHELTAMGTRGRAVVEQDFSRAKLAGRLIDVIRGAGGTSR